MLFIDTLKFATIQDLYNRLKPALDCKVTELKSLGYDYICDVDIWNALRSKVWQGSKDLSLSDMVNDILNTPETFFDEYMKRQLSKIDRSINLDDEIL